LLYATAVSRYRPSLDLSPWVDRPTTTTSLDRLDIECGEQLRGLGFCKNDSNDCWSRPVWAGYTGEQRRLIKGGNTLLAQGTGVRGSAL
jgi:hypothetical protein